MKLTTMIAPNAAMLLLAVPSLWMTKSVSAGGRGGYDRYRYIDLESSTPHDDTVAIVDVAGLETVDASMASSYSVGKQCYCFGTLENGLESYPVETNTGWMTVGEACAQLGAGPGPEGRPLYNDVQCGNGPPNIVLDEHKCPGRVDMGTDGCGYIGPKWNVGGAYVEQTVDACDSADPDCKYLLFWDGKTMYKNYTRYGDERCHSKCVSTDDVEDYVKFGFTCGSCASDESE